MGYCEVEDILALNPKREYNTQSDPTITQIAGYISLIAAQIDMVILVRDYTPSLDYLKLLNAYGVAAMAEMAMFPTEEVQAKRFWKMYTELLEGIPMTHVLPRGAPVESMVPRDKVY